jgi:HK97 gp10 family phage protein
MHFDISELQGLERDLEKGAAGIEPKAHLVVAKIASDIETTAKVFVPVDTSNLQNSISTDVDGLTAEIGPTAEYGDYVERGTHNDDGSVRMEAQPYMVPAAETHEATFANALGKVGESIL